MTFVLLTNLTEIAFLSSSAFTLFKICFERTVGVFFLKEQILSRGMKLRFKLHHDFKVCCESLLQPLCFVTEIDDGVRTFLFL